MFIGAILIVRCVEFVVFMKNLSKTCHAYDWKHVNKNPMCLIDMMKDKTGYYMTSEWSAYNFLYLKGPSPSSMFLSFKLLTIENFYNEEVINKLKKYEVI